MISCLVFLNPQGPPSRPDIRVVTYQNTPVSSDALDINGYELCRPRDYNLVYLPGLDEPLFYIVSPKDIILARPRSLDDHITWLMTLGRYKEALDTATVGQHQLTTLTVTDIGHKFLLHLIEVRDFAACAALCPRVLGNDVEQWVAWVARFVSFHQARALAPYIPKPLTTSEEASAKAHAAAAVAAAADGMMSSASVPLTMAKRRDAVLPAAAVTQLLRGLLDEGDLPLLLELVRLWSPSTYNVAEMTEAVAAKVKAEGFEGPGTAAAVANNPSSSGGSGSGGSAAGSSAANAGAGGAVGKQGDGNNNNSSSATLDKAWANFSGLVARSRPTIASSAADTAGNAAASANLSANNSSSAYLVGNYVAESSAAAHHDGSHHSNISSNALAVTEPLESLATSLPPIPVRIRMLLEILSELLIAADRFSDALSVSLDAGRDDVFELIERLNLFDVVRKRVLTLALFDPRKTIAMLLDHRKSITVDEVVYQLQRHPRLLHEYLHALFRADPAAGMSFHKKQVRLYARFDPGKLLYFLRNSNSYILEEALVVADEYKIHEATVFLLRRMGNTQRALAILVDDLGDVDAALALVEEHKDDGLWSELISRAITNPPILASLLSRVGSHDANALQLIDAIPGSLQVPDLKTHLLHVLRETRSQIDVHVGCRRLLQADIVTSTRRLLRRQSRAVAVTANSRCGLCDRKLVGFTTSSNSASAAAAAAAAAVTNKTKSAPNLSVNGDVTVFGCGHSYHYSCLAQQGLVGHGMKPRCPIDAPLTRHAASNAAAAAAAAAAAVGGGNKMRR